MASCIWSHIAALAEWTLISRKGVNDRLVAVCSSIQSNTCIPVSPSIEPKS